MGNILSFAFLFFLYFCCALWFLCLEIFYVLENVCLGFLAFSFTLLFLLSLFNIFHRWRSLLIFIVLFINTVSNLLLRLLLIQLFCLLNSFYWVILLAQTFKIILLFYSAMLFNSALFYTRWSLFRFSLLFLGYLCLLCLWVMFYIYLIYPCIQLLKSWLFITFVPQSIDKFDFIIKLLCLLCFLWFLRLSSRLWYFFTWFKFMLAWDILFIFIPRLW